MASPSHGCEIGRGDSRARPLPAHSIVTVHRHGRPGPQVGHRHLERVRTSPSIDSDQVAASRLGHVEVDQQVVHPDGRHVVAEAFQMHPVVPLRELQLLDRDLLEADTPSGRSMWACVFAHGASGRHEGSVLPRRPGTSDSRPPGSTGPPPFLFRWPPGVESGSDHHRPSGDQSIASDHPVGRSEEHAPDVAPVRPHRERSRVTERLGNEHDPASVGRPGDRHDDSPAAHR